MAAKLKKGDKVVVLAGRKDKGKEGEITSRRCPRTNKAIVDGINIAIRHTAPDPERARAVASRRRCRSICRTLRCLDSQRQGHPRRLP